MEWWSDFAYLLTHNVYFRAGFMWALVFVAVGWFLWWFFSGLYVQWLKMRQFFEPIKKPGKTPVETGPSPASLLFGCLGRIFTALIVLTIVVGVLYWYLNR